MSWSRARFWAIYALALGAVVLGVLELVARYGLSVPQLPQQYAKNVSDPYLPWKPEPGSVVDGRTDEFTYSYRHNSVGFRDVEHAIQKPPGTFRILGLGDSFTYGAAAAFEETYLAQLETRLNQRLGGHPRVEIIKAGIPRYWPEPERLLLDHYGLAYSPDLVMVAFLPNDVLDTYTGLKGLTVNHGYVVNRQLEALGSTGAWLFLHSDLFRVLFYRYVRSQIEQDASRAPSPKPGDIYVDGGIHEPDWRAIESEYDRIHRDVSRAGAKMVLVSIPQAGPWAPNAEYPAQRLARWSAAHDVTFVNTLPALKAASERAPQYYPRDGHCTPAGYRTVAEAIYDALDHSSQHLLPR